LLEVKCTLRGDVVTVSLVIYESGLS